MDIYISGASQISMQEPLGTGWFTQPVLYDAPYRRSVEADYRQFIAPMAARRMGRLLKRAIAVSSDALRQAGLDMPGAIITGTGLGCIENTENFLSAMTFQGEELLQPTQFIHSTHNTIGAQVALHLHCHGYNSTFTHTGISFESALSDACCQMQTGRIASALVGGHDEMTPGYFRLLEKTGYWKPDANQATLHQADTPGAMAGEASVALVLQNVRSETAMARIAGVSLLFRPDDRRLSEAVEELTQGTAPDALMTGRSGDHADALTYRHLSQMLYRDQVPVLWYKHVFGESYTASAFGVLTAALCLQRQAVPDVWLLRPEDAGRLSQDLHSILCITQFQNKVYALTLLKSC